MWVWTFSWPLAPVLLALGPYSYRVARGLMTISQGGEDCCGWTMMRRQMCTSAPELSHLERALNHVIHQWAKRQSTWSLKSLLLTSSKQEELGHSLFKLHCPGGGARRIWDTGPLRGWVQGLLLLSLCREPSGEDIPPQVKAALCNTI